MHRAAWPPARSQPTAVAHQTQQRHVTRESYYSPHAPYRHPNYATNFRATPAFACHDSSPGRTRQATGARSAAMVRIATDPLPQKFPQVSAQDDVENQSPAIITYLISTYSSM